MTSNMRWAIMLILIFATVCGPALAQPALISSASQINLQEPRDKPTLKPNHWTHCRRTLLGHGIPSSGSTGPWCLATSIERRYRASAG